MPRPPPSYLGSFSAAIDGNSWPDNSFFSKKWFLYIQHCRDLEMKLSQGLSSTQVCGDNELDPPSPSKSIWLLAFQKSDRPKLLSRHQSVFGAFLDGQQFPIFWQSSRKSWRVKWNGASSIIFGLVRFSHLTFPVEFFFDEEAKTSSCRRPTERRCKIVDGCSMSSRTCAGSTSSRPTASIRPPGSTWYQNTLRSLRLNSSSL